MAVVGQAITVIGGENYDAILQIAALIEGRQDLAHLLVNHGDIGEVIGSLSLALLFGRIKR